MPAQSKQITVTTLASMTFLVSLLKPVGVEL